jgi:hypothetical protein
MKLIATQYHSNWAWEFPDGSGMVLSTPTGTMPTVVNAVNIGSICNDLTGLTSPVHLADLKLLAHAQYNGDTDVRPRGDGSGAGVQSSIRYAVFELPESTLYHRDLVIGCMSGFGPRFFLVHCGHGLKDVIQLPGFTGRMLWDLCNLLVESHFHGWKIGRRHEYQRLGMAFLEGRLKKRRKRGEVRLEVVSPPPQPDQDGVVVVDLIGDIPGRPCVAK